METNNSAYAFGMINGIKLLLQKLVDEVHTEPNLAKRGQYVVMLLLLLEYVNTRPTVVECGKFRLVTDSLEKAVIAFDWIPEKKIEMLNLLN